MVVRAMIRSFMVVAWCLYMPPVFGQEGGHQVDEISRALRPSAATPDEAQVLRMTKQLGDDEFAVREEAAKALVSMGPLLLRSPNFQNALRSNDAEVRLRTSFIVKTLAAPFRMTQTEFMACLLRSLAVTESAKQSRQLLDSLSSSFAPAQNDSVAALGRRIAAGWRSVEDVETEADRRRADATIVQTESDTLEYGRVIVRQLEQIGFEVTDQRDIETKLHLAYAVGENAKSETLNARTGRRIVCQSIGARNGDWEFVIQIEPRGARFRVSAQPLGKSGFGDLTWLPALCGGSSLFDPHVLLPPGIKESAFSKIELQSSLVWKLGQDQYFSAPESRERVLQPADLAEALFNVGEPIIEQAEELSRVKSWFKGGDPRVLYRRK